MDPRRVPNRLFALALSALLLTAACDDDLGPGGPPIVISATWQVEGEPNTSFDFRSPDDGKRAGVVTGFEQTSTDDFPLGGHWVGGRIEITIRRAVDSLPKFQAWFHTAEPTRLEFEQIGGTERFVVVR
jgi:hypothetical protein